MNTSPHPRSGWNRRDWLRANAATALLLATGCKPRSTAGSDAPAGVLRLSQRNEPSDLDPARASLADDLFILRAVLEGLVAPSPDGGEPQPAAAERWQVSDGGRTWTFHLRRDGRWSNGEPVTAHDFAYSLRRVLTPATAAPKAHLLFHLASAAEIHRGDAAPESLGARALDERTLELRLVRPAPEFLHYVASGPWLPVHRATVEAHGGAWTRPENFTGNGAFTLAEWRPQQRIVVRRRDGYWDAARVHVEEVHFVAMDNGDAEERAFRAGQLDVTMAVPVVKLPGYAAETPSPLRRVPLHETRFLSFNTRRGPLADARVRRALAHALDRDALVAGVLQGGQTPALHLVPRGLGGYEPREELRGTRDDARRLLAQAGFGSGAGFPRLELSTWTNVAVLEAIQAMWREMLGIEVAIAQREARVHVAALQEGGYDIGFITAIPDVADAADLLEDFAPGAPGNYPQWSSEPFARELAAARAAPGSAERLQKLAAAEAVLLAEAPVAPLYFNAQNFLVRPRVHGWQADALWTRFYKDVSLGEFPP